MGSPLETVFIIVQQLREEREHMRLRIVTAGLQGDKVNTVDLFNELTKEVFFLEEIERRKRARDPSEVLKRWLKSGPLGVQG